MKTEKRKLFLLLLLSLMLNLAAARADTIWVSSQGGRQTVEGVAYQTVTPDVAFKKATAGDIIQFLPGTYRGPYLFKRLFFQSSGKPEQPIIVRGFQRGSEKLSTIDPGMAPIKKGEPRCFRFSGLQWVEFEGFDIRGCWPQAILAENSQYLTFRNNSIEGSRVVFQAEGANSRNFLVEGNSWNQDPSGKMWSEIPWEESHHGRYEYFNGALFGADEIPGGVIFRRNHIRNAFNGIRMTAKPDRIARQNVNVEVYENIFERVRDNPIEPENTAVNWWMHHNEIVQAHGWFSFTEVSGGYWYVFSNIGRLTERYGKNGGHNKGRVFKFATAGIQPDFPLYIFHNSWLTPGLATEKSSRVRHWNNAILSNKAGNTAFLAEDSWSDTYRFDYDISSVPFPDFTQRGRQESHGIIGDPRFTAPENGDFSLQPDSPAIDAGRISDLLGWKSVYDGKAPDIGAYEGGKRFHGPMFRIYEETPYQEIPRIVDLELREQVLLIGISTELQGSEAEILLKRTGQVDPQKISCQIERIRILCPLDQAWKEASLEQIQSLGLSRDLKAGNGQRLTLWGRYRDFIQFTSLP